MTVGAVYSHHNLQPTAVEPSDPVKLGPALLSTMRSPTLEDTK
jgi:hypothetical protein